MIDNTATLRALADRLLIRGDYSAPGQEPSYSDVADATACTESAAEIERLRERVAEAEAERDEYYARAIALFAFVPDDVKAGDLQRIRADFKAWKAAQRTADSAAPTPPRSTPSAPAAGPRIP